VGSRHAYLAQLYAEHEFNASTFTARVIAAPGPISTRARRGPSEHCAVPSTAGANEVAYEIQKRYASPDEAEEDIKRRIAAREVIIGFGIPCTTIADPRNEIIKEVSRSLAQGRGAVAWLPASPSASRRS